MSTRGPSWCRPGAQTLGDASGAPDIDLAHATRLLLAYEFSLGLGDHGQLSVGGKPDTRLILTLPPDTRARLQR